MSSRGHRVATWAALVGIAGWLVIIGVWTWWQVQPVDLTRIIQPIPILNIDREIPIGDPIVMQLDVDKPKGLRTVQTDRFLACTSGNLVTLTQSARDLPPGRYTLISDSTLLPAKVTPGDSCQFLFRITYRINPARTETEEFRSEWFTVRPPR